MVFSKIQFTGLLLLLFLFSSFADAEAGLPPRLIVKTKESSQNNIVMSALKARSEKRQGRRGQRWKKINQSTYKVEFEQKVTALEVEEIRESLLRDNEIDYVEVDIVMNTHAAPGDFGGTRDPRYNEQWSLFDNVSGINMPAAWEISQGSSQQVIAVVDTGILPHPDLSAKLLPGFDMIGDIQIANDGNGRDADATDPGDWVGPGDACYSGFFQNSSWHGTHVAGIAAASAANGIGVAGVDWHARVLPVRVLGKCGGYSTDIADGIRWAAGGSVSGSATNANPAKVINLSLGGRGACGNYMQSAIDFAISRGSVVVVAAGNENLNLDFYDVSPANCRGVITVGSTQRDGGRAGYSNFGQRIDVMAPGGGQNGSILSTYNSGQTTAGHHSYLGLNGTSMAAPHVAGAASLILAVQPGLYPAQVKDILKRSARSLPNPWSCGVGACGAGLIDVAEALFIAQSTQPDGRFQGDDPIRVDDGNTGGKEVEVGSGCGTIDLDPNGPKNGGPFILSLMMMMLLLHYKKTRGQES